MYDIGERGVELVGNLYTRGGWLVPGALYYSGRNYYDRFVFTLMSERYLCFCPGYMLANGMEPEPPAFTARSMAPPQNKAAYGSNTIHLVSGIQCCTALHCAADAARG